MGIGLLVLAAAALGGVWYFVKQRSDPKPQPERQKVGIGEFEQAVPWDQVRIDEASGEFIMIVEAPAAWELTTEELDAFYGDVEACRAYAGKSLAEFYPESEGRLLRVRVHSPLPPPDAVVARLRKIASYSGAVAYDLATEGPDGGLRTTRLDD